jgi:chaperonin cofactor prefoldin
LSTEERLESTLKELFEHFIAAKEAVHVAELALRTHEKKIDKLSLRLARSEVAQLSEPMLPLSPACRCAGLIGSTLVPPEVSKLVADLERRLEEAHCRLEHAEDDAQDYLKRAESDLTKARDQAAHLQTQMDIIHAGYRTMVEDCRIQVDRAHDVNSRLQDECNVRVAAVLDGGASPTQPTSVSAFVGKPAFLWPAWPGSSHIY